jgi:hypothetical protein
MKKSSLAAGLKAAAEQRPQPPENQDTSKLVPETSVKQPKSSKSVLIGGHFPPEVRRVLLLVQAEPENTGKTLKHLLGEAINDLCVKYRKPQPYNGDD